MSRWFLESEWIEPKKKNLKCKFYKGAKNPEFKKSISMCQYKPSLHISPTYFTSELMQIEEAANKSDLCVRIWKVWVSFLSVLNYFEAWGQTRGRVYVWCQRVGQLDWSLTNISKQITSRLLFVR